MSDAPHALIVRRDAAQATLDRFAGQPFAWGKWDCAQMLMFHLLAMGQVQALGYDRPYRSLSGAKRVIKALGHRTIAAAMDLHYPRIAPASAIVGDVLALPSEGPLDAIVIALGNGRVLGYNHDLAGAAVLQPHGYIAAWRVDP